MSKYSKLSAMSLCALVCFAASAVQPTVRAGSISLNSAVKPSGGNIATTASTGGSSANRVSAVPKFSNTVVSASGGQSGSSVSSSQINDLQRQISSLISAQEMLERNQISRSEIEDTVDQHIKTLDLTTKNDTLKSALNSINQENQNLKTQLDSVESTATTLQESLNSNALKDTIKTEVDNRLVVRGLTDKNGTPINLETMVTNTITDSEFANQLQALQTVVDGDVDTSGSMLYKIKNNSTIREALKGDAGTDGEKGESAATAWCKAHTNGTATAELTPAQMVRTYTRFGLSGTNPFNMSNKTFNNLNDCVSVLNVIPDLMAGESASDQKFNESFDENHAFALNSAVVNQYNTNQKDFIDSLKGAPGEKGDKGEPGDAGTAGADGAKGADGENAWHAYCAEGDNLNNIIKPLFGNSVDCDTFTSEQYNAVMGGAKSYCTSVAKLAKQDSNSITASSGIGQKIESVLGTGAVNSIKSNGVAATVTLPGTSTSVNFVSACEQKYGEIMAGKDGESAAEIWCDSHVVRAATGGNPSGSTTLTLTPSQTFSITKDATFNVANLVKVTDTSTKVEYAFATKEACLAAIAKNPGLMGGESAADEDFNATYATATVTDNAAKTAYSTRVSTYQAKMKGAKGDKGDDGVTYTPVVDATTGELSWKIGNETVTTIAPVVVRGPQGPAGAAGADGATGATGAAGADGNDGTDGVNAWTAYCTANNNRNLPIIRALYSGVNSCDDFTSDQYAAMMGGAESYCASVSTGTISLPADALAKFDTVLGTGTATALSGASSSTPVTNISVTKNGSTTTINFLDKCVEKYNEIMAGADGKDGESAAMTWCKAHTTDATAGTTAVAELSAAKMVHAYTALNNSAYSINTTNRVFTSLQSCLDAVAADPSLMGGESAADQKFNETYANTSVTLNSSTVTALANNKSTFIASLKGDKGDKGDAGADGVTYTPVVNATTGELSWKIGDEAVATITPVVIRGPQGETGATGTTYVPSVDAAGNLTWTVSTDGSTPNVDATNITEMVTTNVADALKTDANFQASVTPDTSVYATKEELGSYAKSSDLASYATTEQLSTQLSNYTTTSALASLLATDGLFTINGGEIVVNTDVLTSTTNTGATGGGGNSAAVGGATGGDCGPKGC